MDSTITMTQWNADNASSNSRKVAKLSNAKVLNIDNIDGNSSNKLSSGRKLKVNPIVKENTSNLFIDAIEKGYAVESPKVAPIIEKPAVSEPSFLNIAPVRQTTTNETVNKVSVQEPTYSYQEERVVSYNNNPVNTNNSSLSRLSRMDYNTNETVQNPTPVTPIVRDNGARLDNYLQHGPARNTDNDIAILRENNEKLGNKIAESQTVLDELNAQLQKIKEIKAAKKRAQLDALEEENFSKTATLNGLTEQIAALKELIKQEQQAVSEVETVTRSRI